MDRKQKEPVNQTNDRDSIHRITGRVSGKEVEEMILSSGAQYWKVARALGISPARLTEKLKHDFTLAGVERVRRAIRKAKEL